MVFKRIFCRYSKSKNNISNGEDNADAHLKRQIMGREVVVAVTNGKLDFGALCLAAKLNEARKIEEILDKANMDYTFEISPFMGISIFRYKT